MPKIPLSYLYHAAMIPRHAAIMPALCRYHAAIINPRPTPGSLARLGGSEIAGELDCVTDCWWARSGNESLDPDKAGKREGIPTPKSQKQEDAEETPQKGVASTWVT